VGIRPRGHGGSFKTWIQTLDLAQALRHPSVALRAAALPGLAALSEEAHASLPLQAQERLWAAVAGAAAATRPPAVRVAAARAAGSVAAWRSFVQGQLGAFRA